MALDVLHAYMNGGDELDPEATHEALFIIDVQPDFVGDTPGEDRLAVAGGPEIIAPIQRITAAFKRQLGRDAIIIYSQDRHPEPEYDLDGNPIKMTAHFSLRPDYQTTWPIHCVSGSFGGSIHEALDVQEDDIIVHKGTEVLTQQALENGEDTSYSIFSGHVAKTGERVPDMVRRLMIGRATFVGLAFDHCIGQGAIDAAKAGLEVSIVWPATSSVDKAGEARMRGLCDAYGIRIIETEEEYLAELALR